MPSGPLSPRPRSTATGDHAWSIHQTQPDLDGVESAQIGTLVPRQREPVSAGMTVEIGVSRSTTSTRHLTHEKRINGHLLHSGCVRPRSPRPLPADRASAITLPRLPCLTMRTDGHSQDPTDELPSRSHDFRVALAVRRMHDVTVSGWTGPLCGTVRSAFDPPAGVVLCVVVSGA